MRSLLLVYYGHVLMQDLSVFLTNMRCQCVLVIEGFSTLVTVQSTFSHFLSNFSFYISHFFSNMSLPQQHVGVNLGSTFLFRGPSSTNLGYLKCKKKSEEKVGGCPALSHLATNTTGLLVIINYNTFSFLIVVDYNS